MIYKASLEDQQKLLSLPESGMGYQLLDARLPGETIYKPYVVYNSELIVEHDGFFRQYKTDLAESGYSYILSQAKPINFHLDSIRLSDKSNWYRQRPISESAKKKRRFSGGQGAVDSSEKKSNGKDFFVRLSAFKEDKRIDFKNNRLLEGSYTTTIVDYVSCVQALDEPVDRYALPNDDQIKWAFFVRPSISDVYKQGVVQPAFGHEGGGVEALFPNGTFAGTYQGHMEYGEKIKN